MYLGDITPSLFDMTLTHTGERLLKIHISHPYIGRGLRSRLRRVINRIEELHCWFGTSYIFSFLSSLGPALNLKVLRFRDSIGGDDRREWQRVDLPVIFQGSLPSLREVSLEAMVTWTPGLFRGLHSFELGAGPRNPFSSTRFLDVLRESPMVEHIRLVGNCPQPHQDPPVVALPSLKNCTLIGNGAIYLIWYLDIPASANVFLSGPPPPGGKTELYPFWDLCWAPDLHVLDWVSVTSFSIDFDTVKLRAENDSGGTLDLRMYYRDNVMTGLLALSNLIRDTFSDGVRGFKTTKEFVLHIERGASRDDSEAMFNSATLSRFASGAPGLERITLRGVPARPLSLHFGHLCENSLAAIPFPDLQRLHIESTPLRTPKLLLEDLDRLLKMRQDLGVPLRFVYVKVNCERLIPMTEHSAFLTAWEGLVGEDVEAEYSRDKVEKLPRRGQRLVSLLGDGDEEERSEDEEEWKADIVEAGGEGDLEWESWISGRWPKAVSEVRKTTKA